jgi:hypothetical protein
MSSSNPPNSPPATNSQPNLPVTTTPKTVSSNLRRTPTSKVLSAFKPPRPRGTAQNTPSSTSNKANDLPSRIEQLKASIQHTESQIAETLERFENVKAKKEGQEAEGAGGGDVVGQRTSTSGITATTSLAAAEATLNHHIALLKKYNALKDAGMTLIEVIAEREGKRVVEVKEDFGVGEDD